VGRLGGLGLGSGPLYVVGRLGPGMRVSASFQIIPHPVSRLWLWLGLGSEPHFVGSVRGGGLSPLGIFGRGLGGCLQRVVSRGLSPRIVTDRSTDGQIDGFGTANPRSALMCYVAPQKLNFGSICD